MNAAAVDYDGTNKYIRITDIDENSHRYINSSPVSPSGILENKYKVMPNDILFARTGASVGKTYLYDLNDGLLYFAGFLIRANISISNNSYFIFCQTLTNRYKKWVLNTSMRSGQPGINSQEYAKYKVYIPTLEEQTKIANFLSLIDKRIEKQRQLVESLKKYKRGLISNIFEQKIKLGNKGNWIEIKLSKILKERKTYCEKDGTYEHATLSKDGVSAKTERYERDFLVSDENKKYKITKFGDICYNPANLKFGVICLNNYGDAIFSPIYITFEIDENYNKEFIGYCLTRNDFINKALKYQQGTVYERMAVSPEDLLSMEIIVPKKETQNKISALLNILESKLDAESNKLTLLVKMKSSLLQQMFI